MKELQSEPLACPAWWDITPRSAKARLETNPKFFVNLAFIKATMLFVLFNASLTILLMELEIASKEM
jgi:hypothetical protein